MTDNDHALPVAAEWRAVPTSVIEALARAAPSAAPPRATYRVQFNAGFTFKDGLRLVPYLADLGVGTLYASPVLKSAPGSAHGYDVIDYGALDPEIGSEEEFRALVAALRERDMNLILDFVPNHMGIVGATNAWWLDVLENGQTSAFVEFFDVDWRPLKPELRNKVLLPVLGDHYGAVLENGELSLQYDGGAFTVCYYEQPLPIAPPTYPFILRRPLELLAAQFDPDDVPLLEYQSIITAFERLASQDEREPERITERQREQTIAKRRLAELLASSPAIADAVVETVRALNGTPGEPHSVDALDRLLDEQSYRLAFWRVAAEEINYRRFFAINELAAIRQEVPAVFAATHGFTLRLIGEGLVAGLRIDHPDGLWDPTAYFRQLQRGAFLAHCRSAFEADPPAECADLSWSDLEPTLSAWWDNQPLSTQHSALSTRPLYLVVEKILEHGEALPADWAVDGTVGYEFARVATGLFVDAANRKAFDDLYARYTGAQTRFPDLVYRTKQQVMRVALASEVNVLARALNRISERHRRTRDYTLNSLRDALRDVIACFPVYRTYLTCDEVAVTERDRRYIEAAVVAAKRRSRAIDRSVFDFIRDVLLLRFADDAGEEQRAEQCRFAMKMQQLTGPVMAKGLEDTAFYIDNRLTALNEVGGDPTAFGASVAELHRENSERARRWPHAMLTSSTHDTKRSEDVRARIAVLSEIPREWRAAVNRWSRLNRKLKTRVDGALAPDRNDEYLFYQTVLGAWPVEAHVVDDTFGDRIEGFMLKAIREAQVHTSWVNPNADYDAATAGFVRGVLDSEAFLTDFVVLQTKVAYFGAINALSQQLLKLTSPGVPDVYQGTELWDLSLVDPDNRRPVDYRLRRRLLGELKRRRPSPRLTKHLWEKWTDGRVKLLVTSRTLALRQTQPALFAEGAYLPLQAGGRREAHVCAFMRRHQGSEIITAVPRLVAGLTRGELVAPTGPEIWGDTHLILADVPPGACYRNVFSDESLATIPRGSGDGSTLPLSEVLASFPVALLVRAMGDD